MNDEILKNKSQKTRDRIKYIRSELKSHYKTIRSLNYFARHFVPIRKANFAPRIVKYSSIPRSEERYRWTLKNITDQVTLFENELMILIKYGV